MGESTSVVENGAHIELVPRPSPESHRGVEQATVYRPRQVCMLGEPRLSADYKFLRCPCGSDCWCQRNACDGHYRIKKITFDEFLEAYAALWIPPTARKNLKKAVLTGSPFKQRQRNAVEPLQRLRGRRNSVAGIHRGLRYEAIESPRLILSARSTLRIADASSVPRRFTSRWRSTERI